MKKVTLLLTAVVLSAFLWSCGGDGSAKKERVIKEKASYAQGEKMAIKILVAYDARDLKTLKSYSSGMFARVMDETFFDGIDSYLEAVENWDGEIKEVRYSMQEVTFEKTYYAKAYFADHKDKNQSIYVVTLKSKDKEKWSMSSKGLTGMKKEKFEKMSSTLSDDDLK